MYGKENLELKDVQQILQNNELMKKIDSIEEVSGLIVKGQMGDQRVGDSKGIQMLLAVMLATTARIRVHKKIV